MLPHQRNHGPVQRAVHAARGRHLHGGLHRLRLGPGQEQQDPARRGPQGRAVPPAAEAGAAQGSGRRPASGPAGSRRRGPRRLRTSAGPAGRAERPSSSVSGRAGQRRRRGPDRRRRHALRRRAPRPRPGRRRPDRPGRRDPRRRRAHPRPRRRPGAVGQHVRIPHHRRVRGGGRLPAGADPPRPALPGHVRGGPGHHHAGRRLGGLLDARGPPGAGAAELLAGHPRLHRRAVLRAVHPDVRHVRAAAGAVAPAEDHRRRRRGQAGLHAPGARRR